MKKAELIERGFKIEDISYEYFENWQSLLQKTKVKSLENVKTGCKQRKSSESKDTRSFVNDDCSSNLTAKSLVKKHKLPISKNEKNYEHKEQIHNNNMKNCKCSDENCKDK